MGSTPTSATLRQRSQNPILCKLLVLLLAANTKGMVQMKNKEQVLHVLAEQVKIDESESNQIFLLVDFKMFDNGGNLNNEAVSKAFIDDMMANIDYYTALPLYCDDENLLSGNFRRLGHMYDERNCTFGTQQIGSFVNFRTVEEDGLVSVYGTARIPKRESEICKRIIELYSLSKLSISFEVKFNPKDTFIKDGVRFIDVGDQNKLTGACVVWTPAFPDAQAQQLIAEAVIAGGEEEARTEVRQMDNEEKVVSEVIAEETNPDEVVAELETAKKRVCGEDEEEKKDVETAEDDGGKDEEEKDDVETAEQMNCSANGDDKKDEEEPENEKDEMQAQVLEERVTVTESVEQWDPNCPPVHVVETHERYVETIEEKDRVIAELQTRIAELEAVEQKYNAIVAENEARELAEKQKKAKTFAQKNGLDIENVSVAEAIKNVDYEALANMSMEETAEDESTTVAEATISLVSYAEIKTEERFGNMLDRKQ